MFSAFKFNYIYIYFIEFLQLYISILFAKWPLLQIALPIFPPLQWPPISILSQCFYSSNSLPLKTMYSIFFSLEDILFVPGLLLPWLLLCGYLDWNTYTKLKSKHSHTRENVCVSLVSDCRLKYPRSLCSPSECYSPNTLHSCNIFCLVDSNWMNAWWSSSREQYKMAY